MENLGKLFTFLVTLLVIPIIKGFVIVTLWAWFIVPSFGVREVRIIEVIGFLIIYSFIRLKKFEENKEDYKQWEEAWVNILYIIIMSVITLIIGFIWKQFI
tara:strand:- start:541 stop:843 length:303 start_codon:yes stop_codon:yes gene_type:complete